jgi:hypothetical protein
MKVKVMMLDVDNDDDGSSQSFLCFCIRRNFADQLRDPLSIVDTRRMKNCAILTMVIVVTLNFSICM